MAGTTTNNGWTYPTSTDYVKDGATAIQTLATGIDTSTGKGLIAWQSWAPVLGGGWLNGNGVWTARYCQIGKTVHLSAKFVLGTTTTKGSTISMTLPVTAQAASSMPYTLRYVIGGVEGTGMAYVLTTTTVVYRLMNVAGTYPSYTSFTATTPATWATGDEFEITMTYEAA